MKTKLKFAAAVLSAALVATPMLAQRGSANFSNFVALGDSYGAGVVSNSLNERHQPWSWPAIIARQVGLSLCAPGAAANDNCFAQPLVTYPGIGPELTLTSLAPTIVPAPGLGQPMMNTFGRSFNNLSIPGATVGALLQLTGAEPQSPGEPTAVTTGRFILRGRGTAVQQAVASHPTFVAIWIGGNDYLNVAFSGNPATMTSAADFRTRYEAMLDAIVTGAPSAGVVVGTLPAGVLVPYLTLVPPVLVDPATRQPILNPQTGQPIFFMVDAGNGTQVPLAPTTLLPLQTRDKIAQGYGLPAFLRAIPQFANLPHIGEPLSQNDVITAEEIQQVFARVTEYNAIIASAAAARNIPVADINGLFHRVTTSATNPGIRLGPITVTNAFITGGFFSLDGFHLTDIGYMLFANEYIKAINNAYHTDIPLASLAQLFANNGAHFEEGFGSDATISPIAVKAIQSFWAQPASSVVRRGRAVSH